ncbi:hypothetical protein GQ55_5G534900 [Panicum hallii var. hallii]|uniref:Uncharacterized protein n=1 Tax=Panicum hallii var. hallii TaxID=1504633 RepID=A0A2T7DT67_9POAL|nr:hypothetical protein GQ55_5G534900 [Panicum hallii var. hallii]
MLGPRSAGTEYGSREALSRLLPALQQLLSDVWVCSASAAPLVPDLYMRC